MLHPGAQLAAEELEASTAWARKRLAVKQENELVGMQADLGVRQRQLRDALPFADLNFAGLEYCSVRGVRVSARRRAAMF